MISLETENRFCAHQRDHGFSFRRYLLVASIIAAVAVKIFPLCPPLAFAFFALSTWYLFSAAVVIFKTGGLGNPLFAFVVEVNSIVDVIFLFPLTLFPSYHKPAGNLTGRPILMIHGYLSFGSSWHYQRSQLAKRGLGPIYTMNVGSGKSIKTYADEVQKKALEIQGETGRGDLILIGHSKGGLVSSYFATHLAQQIGVNVTDVVTLGSPLKGTLTAKLGVGEDASEMEPEALFHQDLRDRINKSVSTHFYHIASKQDIVVPTSSALGDLSFSKRSLFNDLGHLSLLFSSRVSDQIHSWLLKSPS